MKWAKFIGLLICVLGFSGAWGQIDTEGLNLEKDHFSWFQDKVGRENSPLLNGTYLNIERTIKKGHPFLESSFWQAGSLVLKGFEYEGIDLLYDVEKDRLIIRPPGIHQYLNHAILPPQNQIESFDFNGRQFRKMKDEGSGLMTGFVEVLWEGQHISLYKKHSKTLVVTNNPYYEEGVKSILVLEGVAYTLQSRYTLYNLFPDKKPEIKKSIREGRINIKAGNTAELVRLVKLIEGKE